MLKINKSNDSAQKIEESVIENIQIDENELADFIQVQDDLFIEDL